MNSHKTADKSLSAVVLEQLIKEERAKGNATDGRIINLVRQVAMSAETADGRIRTGTCGYYEGGYWIHNNIMPDTIITEVR